MESVSEKIMKWSTSAEDADLLTIEQQIEYLADHQYESYHPTSGPYPDFYTRLARWIDQLPSENDQKTFLRLVPNIFFVGLEEFHSLYRAAHNGPIANWLIDEISCDLTDIGIEEKLNVALAQTWFCPISDSMQIATFYHINKITGANLRPDWRSLRSFGDPAKIRAFMDCKNFKRIVLLEDFVGSGSQMKSAVEFAATQIPNSPKVLIAPLLCYEEGVRVGKLLAATHSNVTFTPVLKISSQVQITTTARASEPSLHVKVRDLILRCHQQVCGGTIALGKPPYGPFGFSDTGGLVVMHTNTPDNTLPVIQHTSATWSPLFPRSSRL